MSDLGSFAELIKQANEDKRQRQLAEAERKSKEVAPLLSELFSSVAKAKEVKKEAAVKAAPLLAQLQSALADPEKVKNEKQEKRQKIVDLVVELEQKAAVVQEENLGTVDIDVKIDTALAEADKRFLKLFNRLQNDLQTLKRHVDSKPATIIQGGGSSGGGEVRILRMDDMDRTTTPDDGDTLVWSAALNKFELKPVSTGGGTTVITTDEEMPFAKRVDFITDNELYKGEAVVGSADTASTWRIRKVTIGTDSDITETWAGGSSEYNKRWSDRLTYTYI